MHYALYRKYRPKTFGEVVGQEHVTKTLKAQVKSGQISHSYLFTGTRGTGKTSCAKILARAVNCLSPIDGEPCNECAVCKGLLEGSILDVIEMDAASNNSVENIRQIHEEIVFTPMQAKYKVYIIDEVHMLSTGAFNALLKTLEEPPEHVIFILATTEAHKIPPTILSRCQRFDMHRLSLQTIASHLKKVAEGEGRSFPDDIIYMVASLADGSIRDSLSILDKVMETEDPYMIKETLGVCDSDLLFSLSEAVAKADCDLLFSAVADFYTASKDFSVLIHDLLSHFRFLLMAKTAASPEKFIEKSEEETQKYIAQAPLFAVEQILYILDTLRASLANLSRSPDKRAETEICLLKCARPELSKDASPLSARVSKIENALTSGVFTSAKPPAPKAKNAEVKQIPEKTEEKKTSAISNVTDYFDEFEELEEAEEIITEEVVSVPKVFETVGDSEYRDFLSFKSIVSYVRKRDMKIGLTLSHSCEAIYKNREIIILCSNERDLEEASNPKSRKLIEEALIEDRKENYTVRFEVGSKMKYLSETQRDFSIDYENIENNNLFSF